MQAGKDKQRLQGCLLLALLLVVIIAAGCFSAYTGLRAGLIEPQQISFTVGQWARVQSSWGWTPHPSGGNICEDAIPTYHVLVDIYGLARSFTLVSVPIQSKQGLFPPSCS